MIFINHIKNKIVSSFTSINIPSILKIYLKNFRSLWKNEYLRHLQTKILLTSPLQFIKMHYLKKVLRKTWTACCQKIRIFNKIIITNNSNIDINNDDINNNSNNTIMIIIKILIKIIITITISNQINNHHNHSNNHNKQQQWWWYMFFYKQPSC